MSETVSLTRNVPSFRTKRRQTRKNLKYVILGIVFLLIMLFPVYWMINTSLQPSGNTINAGLFPFDPDFSGYKRAISDQGSNLVTSLVIALGTVVLTLVIATPASYALAKFKYRWINIALLAVLIAQMIPSIVIANALYAAYNQIGLLNSITGLILADATAAIPFAIMIMRAFMMSIPPSIIEAARVDGAGHLRTFNAIVVPVAKNSLITASLFAFLWSWSDFLFALTLTTNDSITPVTLGIYEYLGTQVQNWGAVMATAVLSSIPAIVLLLLAQRYISAGATGGAVK